MAGQGKTTVAQLLMRNGEVEKHFDKKIWACVSVDFNVDRILKDMLQSLTVEASDLTNTEAMVNKLNKELNGKIFLLVLDDVWNEDSELWDHMNKCLQAIGGSKESRILVTTRNEGVVSTMNGYIYRLGVLSEEASQKLFEKIAFGNGRAVKTPALVEIGKRIVKKCGRVPLALKAIGALMSSKRDEVEWLKIEESSIWSTLDALDGVCSVIKLSFDHLPLLSLKQCFAYCSIFPKDSVIGRKRLIQLWMAHGLLNPSRGNKLEMEDVGNNYFNILLQRSLLQENEIDEYGNIITCKMHDLVLDFALEASKGHSLTAEGGVLAGDNVKTVHLSIVATERQRFNIPENIYLRLRTLFLSGGISYSDFLVNCKWKYLRVLVVADWRIEELPNSIAALKHLRFLDISDTRVRVLPDSISKLYYLQTLRLFDLQELPKNFGSMVNLRHLHIHDSFFFQTSDSKYRVLPRIGQLSSLRTLSFFVVSQEKGYQIGELGYLNDLEGNIRILGLENVGNRDEAMKANLSRKRNLESLGLCWDSKAREGSGDENVLEGLGPHPSLKALSIENFLGKTLPPWLVLLRNLVNIKLKNLCNCEQVPSLGHLPCLKTVEIHKMSSVKCIGNELYGWTNLARVHPSQTSIVAFPALRELTFVDMLSLEEWSDAVHPSPVSSVELFPHLEKLEIQFCPNLARLPGFLDQIMSLRSLTFGDCGNLSCLPEAISGLTVLESLRIYACHKLVSTPDLRGLRSLNELEILGCRGLPALPRGIEACRSLQSLVTSGPASLMESLLHLTNLTKLTLLVSKKFDHIPPEPIFNPEDDDIQEHGHFATLQDFTLDGMQMPELKSLPKHIQYLTALRHLSLAFFDGLEALPEWLGNFHSLRSLNLMSCEHLAHFPSAVVMQGLTNLESLNIFCCPILKQRCEKGSGAEWHKIAHIPNIIIDLEFIQSQY